jgi:hypothetical protein
MNPNPDLLGVPERHHSRRVSFLELRTLTVLAVLSMLGSSVLLMAWAPPRDPARTGPQISSVL